MTAPLFPHQQKALDLIERRHGLAGLFMEPRTGKTRPAALYAASHWRRILIVCPISAVSVWQSEMSAVGIHLPGVDTTALPDAKAKAKAVRSLGYGIVIVSYESYWREPFRSALLAWEPQAVICDEAHYLKHRASKQSRFAGVLATKPSVQCRLALTGTPTSKGLEDCWALYRFIDRSLLGSWPEFAARHLVMGGFGGYKVMAYRDEERVRALIAETSYQCNRADVMDCPIPVNQVIRVRLSAASQKVYDDIKRDSLAQLEALDGSSGTVIAQTALVGLLRLMQATGGFAQDVNTKELLDFGNEKAHAARELVESAAENGEVSVVFARFLHDLDKVEAECYKAGLRVARLDGSVASHDRGPLLARFAAREYDVLVCQQETGSLGIDLATASVAVVYSTGYNLVDFLQSRDRLQGPKQTRPVTYYYLVAEQADQDVYDALEAKVDIARRLTSLEHAQDFFRSGSLAGPQPAIPVSSGFWEQLEQFASGT